MNRLWYEIKVAARQAPRLYFAPFIGAYKEMHKEYLAMRNITLEHRADMITDKDVLKLIRNELDRYNKLFASHEQVKKFQLIANEWTIDGGELTATMKLKRKKIVEKYSDRIETIYR